MPNLDRDYYLDKQGLQTLVNELETNIVAEEFSSSATYNLGDYCIYGNLLYICTTPITTAGSWTGSTNWLQVLIGDELSEKTEIQTITLAQWEALTPEQKASGDYVISDATLSSGLTADDVQEAIDELAQGSASSMAQLTDVKLTSPQNGQELVYDNTLTSPYKWENRTTRVELTQAQYNTLVTAGTVLPDVDYYITDAPSMQGTSADLSYDGTTKSVYTKIEEVVDYIDNGLNYNSGDIITASNTKICAGRSTQNGDKILIFYPLDKPVSDNVASITLNITTGYSYSNDGQVAISSGNYSGSKTDGGVYFLLNLNSSITGNRVANAELSTRTLTFA